MVHVGSPAGDTGLFLDVEYLATADPVERFLQQPHGQMADRIGRLSFPAERAALNVPENFPLRLAQY